MKAEETKIPSFLKGFAFLILLLSSLGGLGLAYDLFQKGGVYANSNFFLFIIITMFVHMVVGVAILSKKRWGLLVFKCYLYLMLLAIPIGTYISHKTLQYLKENNIARIYQ